MVYLFFYEKVCENDVQNIRPKEMRAHDDGDDFQEARIIP